MPSPATPAQFIAKWQPVQLAERAASQEHFLDLCHLLGQPTPAEHDATGAEYTFERGVAVSGAASAGSQGERGFADVWWRGKFGWEYKRRGKHRDLADAYRQLCQYREALDNPPLLIVSDVARIEIHTNFTGTQKVVHTIPLAELDQPEHFDKLRRIFTDPESFKPTVTTAKVTEDVAESIGALALRLRGRGNDPHAAAHFLMKCMFCLFAEDVDLLPDKLFSKLLAKKKNNLAELRDSMTELFAKMRKGGQFGADSIKHFNGGLFDKAPAILLEPGDLSALQIAANCDWGSVEPAIFGTLFERSLDPDKRAQIGAHYTSREDILLIVEPVVMAPLRREWQAAQAQVAEQLAQAQDAAAKRRAATEIKRILSAFIERLAAIRILDSACGSGNFLYVAIQQLLNLEKEIITFAAQPDIRLALTPRVRPTQLHGIEQNTYAAELAQVVIWIGYLQWMRDNGFHSPREPILDPLQTIENRDAILDLSNPAHPVPAQWPTSDFIIGNPPFLGGSYIRQNLGDEYTESLFSSYDLPNFSDICCYWFELGRRAIEAKKTTRVGLLATQGIRGESNRAVINEIKKTGDLFMAWSDRDWILDGAAVHVSMIGFDDGSQQERTLDGVSVTEINADLTSGIDLTRALSLNENANIQHEGDKKGADFDIDLNTARRLISAPSIGDLRQLDVCRPWFNGKDVNGRFRGKWIIDFPPGTTLEQAARCDAFFAYISENVAPKYAKSRGQWWIHERPRPAMRAAIGSLPRFLVTVRHAPHRLFSWRRPPELPDSAVVCFARPDDYLMGVLQSAVHCTWSWRIGTQVREKESGDRYISKCFESFALPWPPGREPTEHPTYRRIANAALELTKLRDEWLNPPLWIKGIAAMIDDADDFADVPADARPLIRQSAIMANAANDKRLKKRTLTNLYNERPTWLRLAHRELDRAVLAAYAAIDPDGGWSEDWADVWTDTGAGQPLPDGHPLAARRAEIDQRVLANLLRLNLARAGRDAAPAIEDTDADDATDAEMDAANEPDADDYIAQLSRRPPTGKVNKKTANRSAPRPAKKKATRRPKPRGR